MQGSVARKLDPMGDETATQETTLRPSLWERLRALAKSTLKGKIEEVLLMTLLTTALLCWGGFLLCLYYLLQAYRVV